MYAPRLLYAFFLGFLFFDGVASRVLWLSSLSTSMPTPSAGLALDLDALVLVALDSASSSELSSMWVVFFVVRILIVASSADGVE